MKKFLLVSAALLSVIATAARGIDKVAYGEDNRIEVNSAVSTRLHRFFRLAGSTATQISKSNLTSKDSTHFKLKNFTLNDFFLEYNGGKLCEGQRYREQLSIGNCSGFLIAPDLLVTAGHCAASVDDCAKMNWVFDFKVGEIEDLEIEKSNVYECREIVKQKLDDLSGADYAVIKLDRKVVDREPLKFRTEGQIEVGEHVVVIGSPSGLPLKIAGDATVVKTSDIFFKANLDTFGGNSGSAVFNEMTEEVEGILVRGVRDYNYNYIKQCYEVNHCKIGNASCSGESVTNIELVGLEDVINKHSGYLK